MWMCGFICGFGATLSMLCMGKYEDSFSGVRENKSSGWIDGWMLLNRGVMIYMDVM